MRTADLKQIIREVPDFPKPGITFYDLTTLFRDGRAFRAAMEPLVERYRGERLHAIAGIEARGFVVASVLAHALGLGLILLRKPGKLPWKTEGEAYALEYAESRLEVHQDAVQPGQRVLIVDDLLATGGTARAAGRLLSRLGAEVDGFAFLVELEFLQGRAALGTVDVFSLIQYS